MRPTMGAIVRHCVGISFAMCSSFSSSSRDHSIFLIDGSSHSYQRALHCFGVFLTSRDEMRAHWFIPYLDTAALRISSSVCHVSDASHALTEVLSHLHSSIHHLSRHAPSCAPVFTTAVKRQVRVLHKNGCNYCYYYSALLLPLMLFLFSIALTDDTCSAALTYQ